MGCGTSRLDGSSLPLPIRARPAFLRRLEDIRQRRNAQALQGATLSKKELLLHDKDDDDINVPGHEPRKSSCLPDDNESCVTSAGSANLMLENSYRKGNLDNREGNDTRKTVDKLESKADDAVEYERKSVYVRARDETRVDQTSGSEFENDDDDDIDERMIRHKEDDLDFPGSPSFRVYFTDNNHEDEKDEGDGSLYKNNGGKKIDLNDVPGHIVKVDDPVAPKGDTPIQHVKEGKKRRSFKKVLPRGGQAAMKNLLNVRSCMSSASSAHDQTHLLTPKTPA